MLSPVAEDFFLVMNANLNLAGPVTDQEDENVYEYQGVIGVGRLSRLYTCFNW